MRPLRTILLKHTLGPDSHFDWLLENPADPAGPLVTFRCTAPWSYWARLGRVKLHALPAHRRRYLTYQGPISDGRGAVRRLAAGRAVCSGWQTSRRHLTLHATTVNLALQIAMHPLTHNCETWELVCQALEPASTAGGAVHYC